MVGKVYLQCSGNPLLNTAWLNKIEHKLNELNCGDLWTQAPPFNHSKYRRKQTTRKIVEKAKEKFSRDWYNQLNGPNAPKLRTYKLFKTKFQTTVLIFTQ